MVKSQRIKVRYFFKNRERNILFHLKKIHGQCKVGDYARERDPEKLPVKNEQGNNDS